MDDGVNYLDDLLNEMTKEAEEEDEEPQAVYAAPAPVNVPQPQSQPRSQAPSGREHARPESFRGDFDYLEALLSDIAPLVESQQEPAQPTEDYTNHPPPRRPPSMAPRATTTAAAFDLESTLRDLEDTFYNGLEGATLKRTTSVRQWPTEARPIQEPEPEPNKRDEYIDVLEELVGMHVGDSNTAKATKQSKELGQPTHTTPPPTKDTSVLDQMIESFAGESDKKKVSEPTPNAQVLQNEEKARKVDEDISYLDQMLNSFIGSETIAFEQPVAKPNKAKGIQVLPPGPIPSLRPVEKKEPAEVPSDKSELQFSLGISTPAPSHHEPTPTHHEPEPTYSEPEPARYEPERSRVSRAPVPASASVAAPAKAPALRSTTNFTLGRTTLNMDDLLDQVIHSIVSEDANKGTSHAKQPNKANTAAHDEDEELVSQILGGQELNIVHLERKSMSTGGRGWMVPFSEFEPLLQAKLGIGNHGEAYRPGIWRGTRVVVKRWNTSLTLTFPLQEEISTHVALSHPNLVPVLGACGDGRGLYTLTEYVPGANLHGFMHNGGLSGEKDSTVTIIRIALQIAQAMAYLHSNGIMHRSLAPKNVLLDNTLTARVRDYGLASVKDDVWSIQRASNPRFPLYDSQYVAPELMRGSQYTMQVDVFSFGVLLWEAFAGESAHDGLVLRDLHGCPFSVQKLIKLCVAASPPARPTFATVVKVLSQPMETLLKYSRPASSVGVGESGFFKTDPPPPRTPFSQPYSAPQAYFETPAPKAVDEEEEDKKLQKVLYALSDLIRTPSDHAQIRAINAIESLATKEWNVSRMVVHAFVPRIIDLLHSKFVEVSETSARVVATMLKNPEFCQSFLRSNGIGALFDLLAGPDDGVRLVAAKALTVAAYTTPELTRSEVHVRNGGPALAALLRIDNEFVRVQTAWALGQLLVPGHPLLDAFFASDGVPLVCSLLITGGSPAAELRALSALVPLLSAPRTRAAVPSSIPRKISLLLSSPLPPMRSQALQAVGLLIADKSSVPILLEGHGLSVALLALIQPSPNNPLLLQALDLLRSIAEIPAHASILVRAGLREALHPHLASVDSNVLKSANVLYNLLV
eukprot:Phypoly_transcript_01029.p1 GENE.Phypoly_transcript_01029~~Phypoly_transcript_01029.p1  ORF type:complete len:1091 (-),score=182.35 Phypoly_transcript_01029:398-3670(-)